MLHLRWMLKSGLFDCCLRLTFGCMLVLWSCVFETLWLMVKSVIPAMSQECRLLCGGSLSFIAFCRESKNFGMQTILMRSLSETSSSRTRADLVLFQSRRVPIRVSVTAVFYLRCRTAPCSMIVRVATGPFTGRGVLGPYSCV